MTALGKCKTKGLVLDKIGTRKTTGVESRGESGHAFLVKHARTRPYMRTRATHLYLQIETGENTDRMHMCLYSYYYQGKRLPFVDAHRCLRYSDSSEPY